MSESIWNQNSKTMFLMGLILGIAVCAILALGFLMFGDKRVPDGSVAGVNDVNKVVDDGQQAQPLVDFSEVPQVDESDHVLGNDNAAVTLIEYSDFECPFCQSHSSTLKELLKQYPNDVKLVYRHFPLTSIHANAQKSAEASECAAKLGGNDAFWKMHDKLFEISPNLDLSSLKLAAKEIGLKESDFASCIDSGEMTQRVIDDALGGEAAGVQGTPATFVNGDLISGAVPLSVFESAVETSGVKR